MTQEDYNFLKMYNWDNQTIDYDMRVKLLGIFNRTTGEKRQMTTCNSCWIDIIGVLKMYYSNYQEPIKNKKK